MIVHGDVKTISLKILLNRVKRATMLIAPTNTTELENVITSMGTILSVWNVRPARSGDFDVRVENLLDYVRPAGINRGIQVTRVRVR